MLLESPADAMQQQQQQRRQSGSSAGDGASPVTFSLAAALGRSLSDESGAQGSPMAESPAAPPAGEHAGGAGAASPGAVAATPAHGGSAGVPGAGGGEGEQEWALPTPACIRDWSDDDSSPGCTATGRGHAPAPGERMACLH